MTCVHPLHTDLRKPEHFTDPFCYEPHPLCLSAAALVKREIARINPSEGKMFGVLVVETAEGLGFLAAYSGLLEGRNDWRYFVPPVFDAQDPNGYFKTREHEISLVSQTSSLTSKQMSQDLQTWLFHQYRMMNGLGEVRDLVEIWQDYHSSPLSAANTRCHLGGQATAVRRSSCNMLSCTICAPCAWRSSGGETHPRG